MLPRNRHKSALVEKRTTTINHQTITYTLRRSFKARRIRLEVRQENNHGDSVVLEGNKLAVRPDLFNNGLLELALEQWYRAEAARLINETADKLSYQMGIDYKRIVIRGQKTRSGSCSRKKN